MSISLNANFELLSAGLYLDARQQFNTIIEMRDFAETSIPDGFITYNKETQKHYVFDSSNTLDATLGKWREYTGEGSSEKQIKDWVSGSSYLEGDYIYYEGELYRCLATNNNVDFNENNWEQLTYSIDELTKEDVERLLGLTKEEIEAMTDLILDTEVRLDKTYSSSKIYSAIQQCLEDSKTYTLEEIARASTASYKVVTDVVDMTEEKYLYLLYDGTTNYDIYIVEIDGTPTKIGNTQIDLSNYYTKTEIDNDFLKKADADGKYAEITTVNDKINKTSILSTILDSATDEQVYSASVMNTELGKKLGKTDMSTIIDENSTNDTIPTSKAVYDLINYVKSLITQQPKSLLTYTFSTGHPVLPQLNNDNTYDYTWKDRDNSNGTTTRTLYGSVPVIRVNFSEDTNRQYLKSLDNTVNMRLATMANMFYGCSGLTSVNLTNIDTTNVTDMSAMFYNCSGLTSLDLSIFDTTKVTDMKQMFYNCKGLTTLIATNFNTINVTTMANMFYGCTRLISFASNFNTANVTDMSGMFANCTTLTTVNFDIFDTTKVTTMRSMFNNCTGLISLDLSNFNTANVTDMRYMFYGCNKLTTLRLDNFSSANISNCSEMFETVPSSCSIYRNSSKFTKRESETGFSGTFKNV